MSGMPMTQPDGVLAMPPSGTGDGVLLLHAWWGLNDTMRSLATRLADAGFVTFAPDLYHGAVAATIPEAEALGKQLDARMEQARTEVAEAVAFLRSRTSDPTRGVAAIGFSLGAFYALDLSAGHPEAVDRVVLFYGAGPADFDKARAVYQGHFASDDDYEPPSGVEALRADLERAGRPAEFHTYPGTRHWFFEPDRTQAYDADAAALAWTRTLEFLRRPLPRT